MVQVSWITSNKTNYGELTVGPCSVDDIIARSGRRYQFERHQERAQGDLLETIAVARAIQADVAGVEVAPDVRELAVQLLSALTCRIVFVIKSASGFPAIPNRASTYKQ